ncbi:TPR repeat containing protein [Methanocaldococcus bathoardescens]|uniref:TPR repeat containing protein n=1 Tax=Methanocaldococcus bathoardescens TaxID=1301915 RepID=A0A076LFA0_9EURY|nr:tetratricopeptide repeat protein [Methanocaldococcus bathoardescens]AIJ05108.1 TPR repeat containing protein [Methanocaldococcus bathoardescens]
MENHKNKLWRKYSKALEKGNYNKALSIIDKIFGVKKIKKLRLLRYFNNVFRLNPKHLIAYFLKGHLLLSLGKLNEARNIFLILYNLDKHNPSVKFSTVFVLRRTSNCSHALKLIDEILEKCPNSAIAWAEKGEMLWRGGHLEEALQCFDNALKINPNDCHSLHYKGEILIKLGRYEEALKCFEKILHEINGSCVYALIHITHVLIILERLEEALEYIEKGLKLNPNEYMFYLHKGIILNKLGKYEEAIKCFDRVLSINPNISEAWNGKAVALEKLGRIKEAVECYNKALEIHK